VRNLQENLLFSALILCLVFSDYVVFSGDYHMMRYGIFSMRWASALRGSVSGSGDSCLQL